LVIPQFPEIRAIKENTMSGFMYWPGLPSQRISTTKLERAWSYLAIVLIVSLSATGLCEEVPSAGEPDLKALARQPESPPENIPAASVPLVRPRLAYLAGGSTWNLSSEEFLVFLADFPKAILVRCPAKHLSSDAKFHYYKDFRFELEWAFERAPENNFFVKRSIWSRRTGETAWNLQTTEATLAEPW
jgi:hypothetical protein